MHSPFQFTPQEWTVLQERDIVLDTLLQIINLAKVPHGVYLISWAPTFEQLFNLGILIMCGGTIGVVNDNDICQRSYRIESQDIL